MIKHYEQLRKIMIKTGGSGVSLPGLSILMLQGICAWIKALPTILATERKATKRVKVKPVELAPKKTTALMYALVTLIVASLGSGGET